MSGENRRLAETEIYDAHGQRKYLTAAERARFRAHAETLPPAQRTFCLMLYFTGARISEALELTPPRLDLAEGVVRLRTLKRRKDGVFRSVPLPRGYLREVQRMAVAAPGAVRLWPFSRKTGYRIVKAAMRATRIAGAPASPKGLRHGFGIACVQKNIPLPLIAKWMGHSTIKTTAIYLNAVGHEERQFAKRIW